jgi:hypothetical protein
MALEFMRKDKLVAGIIAGILLPIVVIYIQYRLKYSAWTLNEFIAVLKNEKRLFTGITTIALIGNGFLFGLLIQFKKYFTARGVFIPTVVFGIGILLYKLF